MVASVPVPWADACSEEEPHSCAVPLGTRHGAKVTANAMQPYNELAFHSQGDIVSLSPSRFFHHALAPHCQPPCSTSSHPAAEGEKQGNIRKPTLHGLEELTRVSTKQAGFMDYFFFKPLGKRGIGIILQAHQLAARVQKGKANPFISSMQ